MAYYRFLGRGTIRRASWIITTSQYYAAHSPFLEGYLSKTSAVPPGVDVATFNPAVDSNHIRNKVRPQKDIILFVGQLSKAHRHKGLPILIRALRSLDPNVTLVVVGDGNWRRTTPRMRGVSEFKAGWYLLGSYPRRRCLFIIGERISRCSPRSPMPKGSGWFWLRQTLAADQLSGTTLEASRQ